MDGSEVIAQRVISHYNSSLGEADKKVETWLEENPYAEAGLVLWGVGNHGGGPSREDVQKLDGLIASRDDIHIRHATPEDYFDAVQEQAKTDPVWDRDINPWASGCYTTMSRIKQKHRELENRLYRTEKMLAVASVQDRLEYPEDELQTAMQILCTSQFHDILPGSSVPPVEESALRQMDYGLEILSRLQTRAFFSLCEGQPKANEGEIPILVYNPHPYAVTACVECEFNLAMDNRTGTFTQVSVFHGDKELPSQVEHELSNLDIDWRKRVVFRTELQPSQMNRYDCKLEVIPDKPAPELQVGSDGLYRLTNEDGLDVHVDSTTGLLTRYRVDSKDYIKSGTGKLLVIQDTEDSWGWQDVAYRTVLGEFALLDAASAAETAGVPEDRLAPVRVIEDGPVRSVIEALFGYNHSTACVRYIIPKSGTEIEIQIDVIWTEKDRFLKYSLETPFESAHLRGQTAFGIHDLPDDGREAVAQKWVAVEGDTDNRCLTVINDRIYGCDHAEGELRLSLLRSPAYSGLRDTDRVVVPRDRYSPRIDQGEQVFHFWVNGGEVDARRQRVDHESLVHNEQPVALSFFPSGQGHLLESGVQLSDPRIQMSALRLDRKAKTLTIRLWESTGHPVTTTLSFPFFQRQFDLSLDGFEIKTVRLDVQSGELETIDLMELN